MTNRVTRILDARTHVGRGVSLAGMLTILVIGLVVIPGAGRPASPTPTLTGSVGKTAPAYPSLVDQEQDETPSETEAPANQRHEPTAQVDGVVVNEKDEPVASASIVVHFLGRFHTFKTDSSGHFEFDVPKRTTINMLLLAANSDQTMQASHRVGWDPESKDYQSLKLKLQPVRSFVVQVNDHQGQVVPDVKVGCISGYSPFSIAGVDENGRVTLQIPRNLDVEFLFAFSKKAGADYRSYVIPRDRANDKKAERPKQPSGVVSLELAKPIPFKITVKDREGLPIEDLNVCPTSLDKPGQSRSLNISSIQELFGSRTDKNGVATFAWIPDWPQHLSFSSGSRDYTHESVVIKPNPEKRNFELQVARKVSVEGSVKLPNGTPVAGMRIRFHGRGLKAGPSRGVSSAAEVYTDDLGRFEMKIAPRQAYLGFSQDKKLKFASPVVFTVGDTFERGELDLTAGAGTRVFGNSRVATSDTPMANQTIFISQLAERTIPIDGGEGNYRARPGFSTFAKTNDNGDFEVFLGAGEYSIRGSNQAFPTKLTITDQSEIEVNFEPKFGTFTGTVTDTSGKMLEGVEIQGIYAAKLSDKHNFKASTNDQGEFEVEREMLRTVMQAKTKDGKLGAIVELKPADAAAVIELLPTIDATGRLVDADGKPMSNRKIEFGRNVYMGKPKRAPFMTCFGETVTTDENGTFRLDQLVAEAAYVLHLISPEEDPMKRRVFRLLEFAPEEGESEIALGDVPYVVRVPYERPTLEERIAIAFGVEGEPVDRLDKSKNRAKLTKQHLLVLFADPSSSMVKQFSQLQYEDTETRQLFFGYVTMAIASTRDHFEPAELLAKKIDVAIGEASFEPMLAVVDADGETIASSKFAVLFDGKGEAAKISKMRLQRFLTEHTPKPLDGRKLLDDALTVAKRDGKRVIVQETATWCGPCLSLSKFLDNNRAKWSDDYIWVKMDHRWTNAREIMAEFRKDAQGGVPWTAILDENQNVLATSNDEYGDNIGFPSELSGRLHFKSMLMKTKIRLTDEQVNQLVKQLKAK